VIGLSYGDGMASIALAAANSARCESFYVGEYSAMCAAGRERSIGPVRARYFCVPGVRVRGVCPGPGSYELSYRCEMARSSRPDLSYEASSCGSHIKRAVH
jgi:hypothetical protein